MVEGSFDKQSTVENLITKKINETNVGPLGLKVLLLHLQHSWK